MELGCNCGVNLNGLHNVGYRRLAGIEMNANALAEMGRSFPDLERIAEISLGTLEDLLPKIPSKSVDVVFSMGVLMHVHPKSHLIFSEMVRIARRYVAIIELRLQIADTCLRGITGVCSSNYAVHSRNPLG